MFSHLLPDFAALGLIVQVFGSLILAAFVASAWFSLAIRHNLERARLFVADGVIACLTLMTVATVLRTISIRNWPQVLSLTLVLFLRILLKRLFVWEKSKLALART